MILYLEPYAVLEWEKYHIYSLIFSLVKQLPFLALSFLLTPLLMIHLRFNMPDTCF